MVIDLEKISVERLKEALRIREEIESLTSQLRRVTESDQSAMVAPRKKNRMSAAGKAAIRAAQKARWAKVKGKGNRTMSAAGRAKIAAAAKRRWAAAKAAGKSRL